jgi:hypothetical protein
MLKLIFQPACKSFWLVKGKEVAAARIWFEQISKAGFCAGAEIQKRQRLSRSRNPSGRPLLYFSVCNSKPLNVLPSFLASTTPTAI